MSALNDFVVAAGSYFGLPENRVMEGSTVETTGGEMELVLRIVLTTDDVVGIGNRMQQMRAFEKARQQPENLEPIQPSKEELRKQWDSLPASQKSAFGSFAKFKAAAEQAAQVQDAGKSDTRMGFALDLPSHVWVLGSELTEYQKLNSLSQDGAMFAVDPADLTDEQRDKAGIQ